MSIQSLITVFAVTLLGLPQASAQTRPKPTAVKTSPVAKPQVPQKDLKKIQKANRRTQRRAAGERKLFPRKGKGKASSGVVRTGAKDAGVIDDGKKAPIKFDPSAFGDKAKASDETSTADIIEWKTNFEKGIKCKKLPLNAKLRIDFNEITLSELTKFISCITGQNFLLSAAAKKGGTISILSPKPVTAYEAYKAYLSALKANNLTIVPNGKFLEIVADTEAKQRGASIKRGKGAPNNDSVVTRLIPLQHVAAEEITPILDKFKTKSADITVYGPTNTLFVTDSGRSIRRLVKLIKELDVPIGKDKIWIREIQYAEAKEIVNLLNQLFQGSKKTATRSPKRNASKSRSTKSPGRRTSVASVVGATGGDLANLEITKMFADERTNSIIFVATRTNYFLVDRLLRKLDVPIPGEGQIHIHYLENAEADEISQALSNLASGRGSGRSTGKRKKGKSKSKSRTSRGSSGAGVLFEGEVKITAYKPTNALVIEASRKDYLSIQKVIRQLDIQRKQVYVEAIVMEISQNNERELGVSGSGGHVLEADGEQLPMLFGVGGLGLDVQSALSTLQGGGGALGLQGPMVDVSGGATADAGGGATFSIPAFGFLLRAIQTTSNVNVLSTPHVLTLDNEDAEIQVGKRQPYRNSGGGLGGLSSLAGLGGLGGGASSALGGLGSLGSLGGLGGGLGSMVQYVDVDLSLKITPQVNASDFVRLKIEQSIEDIEGFFAEAPITSKRKVSNVVVVPDGQPVVIGGLMRDQESESVDKIPFLGDIPLLGAIFRRTKKTIEKRNLLLIIIPHVIKDPSDLKRIHEQRRNEYRKFATIMAQRKKEFEGKMDYRKKNGLLQDIFKRVERARKDREIREQIILDASDVDTVGPPETHDIEYDPSKKHNNPGGGE